MKILLNENFQLNCLLSDDLFVFNVSNLLEFTDTYFKRINSAETVNTEMVTAFGDTCLDILKTKTDKKNGDLINKLNYQKIFVGEYSDKFIEIMDLIQDLCQQSWNLDTYPTLELLDKGVRQEDKKHFYKSISLLHNKLLLLTDKIQKNRE